jgi:hypothetical protein
MVPTKEETMARIVNITANASGHFDASVTFEDGTVEEIGDLYDVNSCIQWSRMVLGQDASKYFN